MGERADPRALAEWGRLALRARGVVEGLVGGTHRSPFKGFSVEFAEHRQYYPGDEIRHVDWRVFGKTDRHFVKEFEEETNLHAHFLVDGSGSMGYAGAGPTKYAYACEATLALAYLLLGQRDAVGLTIHGAEIGASLPPSTRKGHWLRLADALEAHRPAGEAPLGALWRRAAETMPRRGLVVLVTDAFSPLDDLVEGLRRLRHARHETLLLQVLAPEEIEFPFRTGTRFKSLESDERIAVDPNRIRDEYLEAFGAFQERLAREALGIGVDVCKMRTDRPAAETLGEFLGRRASRIG